MSTKPGDYVIVVAPYDNFNNQRLAKVDAVDHYGRVRIVGFDEWWHPSRFMAAPSYEELFASVASLEKDAERWQPFEGAPKTCEWILAWSEAEGVCPIQFVLDNEDAIDTGTWFDANGEDVGNLNFWKWQYWRAMPVFVPPMEGTP